MGLFMSTKIRGILAFATVFLSVIVPGGSADVKCENIYKDFSECVLELGESMDNYQENVTSEKGVEAVCSHWEAFHTCALTALSDCQEEVSSIWETLRQDSRKIRFQGSLFDLCSPSSSSCISSSLTALILTLVVILVMTGPNWFHV
ncbi:neuritin-like [Xenentodon cancila]